MSHFKDFMWVDGWSTTRERTVVKIPINQGQRNMTWAASSPYLPMAESVDWNCIPSALGCGSVLNVSTGRLHFPLAGSWLMPLNAHPGVHPVLTSWWWIHNFKGGKELKFCRQSLLYSHAKSSCSFRHFGVTCVKSFPTHLWGDTYSRCACQCWDYGLFSFPSCSLLVVGGFLSKEVTWPGIFTGLILLPLSVYGIFRFFSDGRYVTSAGFADSQ